MLNTYDVLMFIYIIWLLGSWSKLHLSKYEKDKVNDDQNQDPDELARHKPK